MYADKQAMIDRFSENEVIQLTDRDNLGVIDDAVLDLALKDADGDINGHLSSRYGAPINPVPLAVIRVACDIARYYLHDDNATDHVTKRYNDGIKFLEGVGSGKISIGIDAAGEKPESGNVAEFESGGNVFNRKDNSFI